MQDRVALPTMAREARRILGREVPVMLVPAEEHIEDRAARRMMDREAHHTRDQEDRQTPARVGQLIGDRAALVMLGREDLVIQGREVARAAPPFVASERKA